MFYKPACNSNGFLLIISVSLIFCGSSSSSSQLNMQKAPFAKKTPKAPTFDYYDSLSKRRGGKNHVGARGISCPASHFEDWGESRNKDCEGGGWS